MAPKGRSSSNSRSHRPSKVASSSKRTRLAKATSPSASLLFLALVPVAAAIYIGTVGYQEAVDQAVKFGRCCWEYSLQNQALVVSCTVALILSTMMLRSWARPRGGVFAALADLVVSSITMIPGVKGAVDSEIQKIVSDLEQELLGAIPADERISSMPEEGLSADEVLDYLDMCYERDTSHWKTGKLSGTIYHGGDDLFEIISVSEDAPPLFDSAPLDVSPSAVCNVQVRSVQPSASRQLPLGA
jgi:hypothetical protein